ncbi:MAG: 3-oxoacyl-ACP reductase [Gammaproteobacteria bacterium]|nr:3-oxoacyl-ACP reductase [Gammaproteobacteria bacterium]
MVGPCCWIGSPRSCAEPSRYGVGRGIALALSDADAQVVICGRTPETLEGVLKEIEARGGVGPDVVCDITRAADLQRLVATTLERFGRINILVNNASLMVSDSPR